MRCSEQRGWGRTGATRSRVLRVALREPYRCGANLPAAPTGVKAEREAAKWNFSPATRAGPPSRRATPRPRATRGAAARSPARQASSAARAGRCRARARADRPTPRAAGGCGGARPAPAGSCGLDAERPVVGPVEFVGRRPQRGGRGVLGRVALDESPAEVIARAFGEDPAAHEPRRRRQAPAEEPQAQPEAGLVEHRRRGAPQEGVELAGPAVLAPRV